MKKGKSSILFDKSIELANILNQQLANDSNYKLPSETPFEWDQLNYNRFRDYLNEVKAIIKYDENGTANESYEMIMNMKGIALAEAEMSNLTQLTDMIYQNIYHYSDRWSLSGMGRVVSLFEYLSSSFLPQKNIVTINSNSQSQEG